MKHTRRRVPKRQRRRNKSRARKSKHNKKQHWDHRHSSKKRTFRRKRHMKGGDLFASDTTTLFGINNVGQLLTNGYRSVLNTGKNSGAALMGYEYYPNPDATMDQFRELKW